MAIATDVDVLGFLKKVQGQLAKAKRILEVNNFVIDNLDDRWQKLAFTLYTDIAAMSTEAEQILKALAEKEEP